MIKKITVKGEFRNRTYLDEVEDGIDFFDAVKKASADFVNTPDGRKSTIRKVHFPGMILRLCQNISVENTDFGS